MQLVDECLASGQIQTWIHNPGSTTYSLNMTLLNLKKKKNVNRNNMELKYIKIQRGTQMY